MKRATALELIDIITNKINPPHEKTIVPIPSLQSKAKQIEEELKPSFLNLRGVLEKELDYCDVGYRDIQESDRFTALENSAFLGDIRSISRINDKLLAVASARFVYIVEIKNLKIIHTYSAQNKIFAISRISDSLIAFGGDDRQVTLLDIGDPKKPKVISTCRVLEEGICETKTDEKVTISANRALSEQTLYRYAWFADQSGRCVPYYIFEESGRVTISDDRMVVVLH